MNNLLLRYKEHLIHQNYSRLSVKNYVSDIHNFTAWLTSIGQNLSDIPSLDLSLYTQLLHERHLAPASISRKKTALKLFLVYLTSEGIITGSPKNLTTYQDLLSEYQKHLLSQKTSKNTLKNYLSDTRSFLTHLTHHI